MQRFLNLAIIAAIILIATLAPRALSADNEDLEGKFKHLEEDIALVKELLRLRGSSTSPSKKGSTIPPASSSEESQKPTTKPAEQSNDKSNETPTSESKGEKKGPATSGNEKYPPGNPIFADWKSTVTYDAPNDRSRLSITSFKYNLKGEVSSYVDRIFGSKALYYDEKMAKDLATADFTDAEIKEAEGRFAAAFKLKDEDKSLNPPCSVDMLGLWHPYLDADREDHEFTKSPGVKYKNDMLRELKDSNALGEATLHISSLVKGAEGESFGKEEWKCYYRDVWKLDNRVAAVFFFCPSPSQQHCEHLEAMATKKPDPNDFGWGRVKADVSMKSLVARSETRVVWRMSFEAKFSWRGRNAERENTKDFKRRAGMAVCTVIPYRTFDTEKAKLNGVMIFEWLRYYLRLGYKVHMYDRDGSNAQYIFSPGMNGEGPNFLPEGSKGRTYHGGASTGNFEWNNLVYHNYTMLSVLDGSTNGVLYDNTEGQSNREIPKEAKEGPNIMGAEERKWLTDRDKSMTFTQCRMEIDALWGIGDVFTGDFDEFMFCPEAPLKPQDQYDFVRSKLNEEKDKGMHAMQVFQRVPANASDLYPRECILEKLKNGDASILECYAPYKAIVGAHSFKSYHLGHVCPVQNYHQSYNTNKGYRQFECGNKNYISLDTKICALMHLTTHPKDFQTPCCGADKWEKSQIDEFRKKENNELWKIVHYEG